MDQSNVDRGESRGVRVSTSERGRAHNLEANQLRLAESTVGDEAAEEGLVALGALVEHARVNGGGQQIVCGGDGVDVTRQVQIELRDEKGALLRHTRT
jgi:hypothetical protein